MHPSTLSALVTDALGDAFPSRIDGDRLLLLVGGVWMHPDAVSLAEFCADLNNCQIGGDNSEAELFELLIEQVPMETA